MKKNYFVILFITIIFYCCVETNEPLPILYWHSAGESCCETEYVTYSSVIRKYLGTSIYIKSAQIGNSVTSDKLLSLTMHPFEQIKIVCDAIKNDTAFRNGYNGIGLSQGALLLRALVQSCDGGPQMRNLISLGGPQQGIYQYPKCGKISSVICATLRFQLNRLIYSRPTQNLLTPATYWHDIVEKRYLKGSTFLAIINNEKEINENYRNNLKTLKKFIMVKYDRDTSVIPNESSFFAYFDSNKRVIPLRQSSLYLDDKIGLKLMDENGQLGFINNPGTHLEFHEEWFSVHIVKYLKS